MYTSNICVEEIKKKHGSIMERIVKSLLDGGIKNPAAIAKEHVDSTNQLSRYSNWCKKLVKKGIVVKGIEKHFKKEQYRSGIFTQGKGEFSTYKLNQDKTVLVEYLCNKCKLKLTDKEKEIVKKFLNHKLFLTEVAPKLNKWSPLNQSLVITFFNDIFGEYEHCSLNMDNPNLEDKEECRKLIAYVNEVKEFQDFINLCKEKIVPYLDESMDYRFR